MGVRILEGASKAAYYASRGGTPDPESMTHRQIMKSAGSGPQNYPLYKSLFTGEEETIITRNQAVDGSVTPVKFCITPPVGQTWILTRMMFIIRDGGSMDSGGWGNNGGSPLANGVTVGMTLDGTDIDFTPIPWTSHVDLGGVAYDVDYHNWGSGDTWLSMRLTFAKAGTNLRLRGDNQDCFWMKVNDDLTYLVEQRCMVQGSIEGLYLN